MRHPKPPRNEWAVTHRLETVRFNLNLYDFGDGPEQSLTVHGGSATKRTSLWTYAEHFDDETSRDKGYSVGDALHHIALVAIQDRPSRLQDLELALKGGVSYGQEPLF